jgi:thioester reductase-like protein
MNIFLTGSTGLLGGEILVNICRRKEVEKVFCFVRAESEVQAKARLKKVFALHGNVFDHEKIIPVCGNLLDPVLVASLQTNKLLAQTNVIIHAAANTSFSRMNDSMIDAVNINGLESLLRWAAQLSKLSTFLHISTATVCGSIPKNRLVYEHESPNVKGHHVVRYSYSKMQAELLINKYLPQEKILVARPSIIMGDSRPLPPRSNVILWTVAAVNQLRLVPLDQHAMLDMVPVDYASSAIIELLFARRKHNVYHISSGKHGVTSAYKVLQKLEEYFTGLPPFCFVEPSMIRQMKLWAKNDLQAGSELYSYATYLDYWLSKFMDAGSVRILFSALTPYLDFIALGQAYDNTRLLEDVPTLRQSQPADVYIDNCMVFLEKINILHTTEHALT